MMRVVEPAAVKAGGNVNITGENLGKEFVAEVYLSSGTTERKVEIVAQTDESITFKVPAECKPAAYKDSELTRTRSFGSRSARF